MDMQRGNSNLRSVHIYEIKFCGIIQNKTQFKADKLLTSGILYLMYLNNH